jgi:ATP-dependent Lon protease
VRKGLVPRASEAQPPQTNEVKPFRVVVTARRVAAFLGRETFPEKNPFSQAKPGLVHGLAWTETGGTLLAVEAALLEGSGELILTGNLGEVMKESAQTALSFLRANAGLFRMPAAFTKERDIHVHVPEGSIPKDGPSAGISITAALLSAASGLTVHPGHTMTGEITLTGRLLPVGGVKEKVLAAHRNRFTHVLLPEDNRKDVEELPREVRTTLHFLFAESIQEALFAVFPPELRASS